MNSSSNQLLKKIIAEEAAIIRANINLKLNDRFNLIEYMVQSKFDPNFKVRPGFEWATSMKPVEDALKRLGAKLVPVGTFGVYGYELDVQPEAGGAGDRLWIYEDYIQSTNQVKKYDYRAVNGKIELLNDDDKSIGTLERVGSKIIFKETEQAKLDRAEAEKKAHPNQSRELLKTILDWVGIIPVIGDAADVVAAYLYFEDGEMVEGLISCIGLLPIVGDAIQLVVKPILKGAKALKNLLKGAKNAQEVWEMLKASKKFSPEMLEKIHDAFKYVADKCPDAKNALLKYRDEIRNGSSVSNVDSYIDEAIKKIDDFHAWLKQGSNSMDQISHLDATPGKFSVISKMPEALQKPGVFAKVVNTLSLGLVPKLKKMPWFPTKKVDMILKAMEHRFADGIMKHPSELAKLFGFAPKAAELSKRLDGIIRNSAAANPGVAAILTPIQASRKAAKFSGTRSTYEVLKTLGKSNDPMAKELYTNLSKTIVDHSIKNNSVMWTAFKSSAGQRLRTVLLSPKAMNAGRIAADVKMLDTELREYVPLIYNEGKDLFSEFGIGPDNPDGVIIPIIDSILGLNDTSLKDVKNNILRKIGANDPEKATEAANAVVKSSTELLNLTDDIDYNPSAEATGTYK